jgi:LAO/AO transport system kinase
MQNFFANNLKKILHQRPGEEIPIFKTVGTTGRGINEVAEFIISAQPAGNNRKAMLLAEKAYLLIQQKRMVGIDKKKLQQDIAVASISIDFNLYAFVDSIKR